MNGGDVDRLVHSSGLLSESRRYERCKVGLYTVYLWVNTSL